MFHTLLIGRLRCDPANVMVDEHELTSVLSDFARTLISSVPLPGNLDSLVARIVEVLPATSAGITLITAARSPRYVAASDDAAVRYEKLQTTLGQGPCLLAYDSGIAVEIPDICADDRFPLFGPAAYEAGLGAVFTFPLRHGEDRLGALDVYRDTPGPFDLADMEAAQTLADVVSACLTLRSTLLSAAESARANQESLSVVSHEMRTPLTSIKGALDLMAAGATGDLTDPVQRMVHVAVANTERLLGLVNGLLDLARVESGPGGLTFGREDLSELIRRSVDMMSPLAERAGVRVVFTEPEQPGPIVDVDGDRVIQTITNLLSNAVKFSPTGSVVSIVFDVSSKVGAVEVRVVDHGRGVPPDLLEDVFARFRQTEARDARSGTGTGLGLAICRSVVEGHHGSIWLERTPGGGATCVFTLPLPAAVPDCGPLGVPG